MICKYNILNAAAFVALSFTLTGCGLYTPVKDVTQDENARGVAGTAAGEYEAQIAAHVACEVRRGLLDSIEHLHWLKDGGTTVTQTITVADQSGIAPGVSLIQPLQNAVFHFPSGGNVTASQSFSLSFGITASANALRTETIQYTFPNKQLMYNIPDIACNQKYTGVLVDGDLKIDQFIRDKATIAEAYKRTSERFGIASSLPNDNIFNTFTEEITFVAAYGGSATPTWKLARVSANTSSNFLVAERTITNDLIITIGPLLCADRSILAGADKLKCNKSPSLGGPVELVASAMNQHNTRVQASAIAVSVTAQSH